MDKSEWRERIKEICEEAGTYQGIFDPVIETLADIMDLRDNAAERFSASGGSTIVKHTNKGGATNIVKNPALAVLMECNAQALTYWRELGLTPRAHRQIITLEKDVDEIEEIEPVSDISNLEVIRAKFKVG